MENIPMFMLKTEESNDQYINYMSKNVRINKESLLSQKKSASFKNLNMKHSFLPSMKNSDLKSTQLDDSSKSLLFGKLFIKSNSFRNAECKQRSGFKLSN